SDRSLRSALLFLSVFLGMMLVVQYVSLFDFPPIIGTLFFHYCISLLGSLSLSLSYFRFQLYTTLVCVSLTSYSVTELAVGEPRGAPPHARPLSRTLLLPHLGTLASLSLSLS